MADDEVLETWEDLEDSGVCALFFSLKKISYM